MYLEIPHTHMHHDMIQPQLDYEYMYRASTCTSTGKFKLVIRYMLSCLDSASRVVEVL
eukprot:SAG31_NODE_353_length_17229_cov_8.702160_10_plen_58_part_00